MKVGIHVCTYIYIYIYTDIFVCKITNVKEEGYWNAQDSLLNSPFFESYSILVEVVRHVLLFFISRKVFV
jgi:hypothetical protein